MKNNWPFSPSHTSPHLVASTTLSRRPAMAWPTISSDRPNPYIGAVSIRLTPASMLAWMAPTACPASVPPHIHPPIAHVPRPTTDA